jgi:hypothetical protein
VIPVSAVRGTLEIVLGMYQSAARGEAVRWPLSDDPIAWE